MGIALDTVGGRVTNPGGTITAYTANTGDSFTVRNFTPGTGAYALNAWGLGATAGIQQLRSPRMHDDVRNYRARLLAANSLPVWQPGLKQLLYAQDQLVFEASGGGAETDSGAFLVWYQDIGGGTGRYVDYNQVLARGVNVLTTEVQCVSGATLGDWSGSVALNSSSNLLKANVDYAVLGLLTDTNVTSLAIRGTDTGNLRAGCPGTTDRRTTVNWFKDLAQATGLPTIPVINAANAGGTYVDVQHNTNAVTVTIDVVMVQLG